MSTIKKTKKQEPKSRSQFAIKPKKLLETKKGTNFIASSDTPAKSLKQAENIKKNFLITMQETKSVFANESTSFKDKQDILKIFDKEIEGLKNSIKIQSKTKKKTTKK